MAVESLEPRALLAVTAQLIGGDLVIAYNDSGDVLADISSDGTKYTVSGTGLVAKQFKIADVTGVITVADKASKSGQTFQVLSGNPLAAPLQVDANVETTSLLGGINASLPGDVLIGSPTISLADDISTATKNGNISLTGAVTLEANVALNAGSGAISFNGTVNGGKALTANSTGATTFAGVVGGTSALASLTTDAGGTASLKSVTTSGAQSYGDDTVTLDGTYTTTNAAFSVAKAASLAGNTTVSTGSGAISFNGTVNGGNALTANSTGATTFGAAVGGTTALASLTTDAGGTASLKSVTTSGAQSYGDDTVTLDGTYTTTNSAFSVAKAASLAGNTTVSTGSGAISFNGTVNGGKAITANSTGATTFAGAIGGSTALSSLTTNAGGTVSLKSVTTSGKQTYNDAATITDSSTFTASDSDITFASTLDGAKQVTLAAGTGAVAFKGAVGGTTPLAGITLSTAGSTTADSSIKLVKTADSGQDGLTVAAGVNNVKMIAAGSSITGFAGNGITFLGGSTNSQLTGFTVSENSANGMTFAAGSYTGTTITGNTLSKNGDFTTHVGNGILVQGSDLMIGWDALPGSNDVRNKIFKNALNGIEIQGAGAQNNTILSNTIYLNGQDVTELDAGDTRLVGQGIALSSGGNGGQVAPEIFDVVRNTAKGKVYVQLRVPASGNYLVQLFANSAADEQDIFPVDAGGFQGRTFVGGSPTNTPAPVGTGKPTIGGTPVTGNKMASIEVDANLVGTGQWITATATALVDDAALPANENPKPTNTSGFSAGVQAANAQALGAGGDSQAPNWLSVPTIPGQTTNRYVNELAYSVVKSVVKGATFETTINIPVAGQMTLAQLGTYTNRTATNRVIRRNATTLANPRTDVTLAPAGGTNVFGVVTAVSRDKNTAMQLTLSGVSLTPNSTGFLVLGTPSLPAARLYDATNGPSGPIISVGPATTPANNSHYDMVAALTDPSVVGIGGKGPATNAEAVAFVSRFQGGMRVASADVNGDGFVDLVTAAGNAGTNFSGTTFGDSPRIITIYNGNPDGAWRSSSINVSGESGLAAYTGGFQVNLANLRPENTGSGNAVAELVVASSNQVFVYEITAASRGGKPVINPVTALPPITTGGTITGLATGNFSDGTTLDDIVVATTTASPAQVTGWLSSPDKSLAQQRTSSVTLYSAAAAFAPVKSFTLASNVFNGPPTAGGREQNVFIGGASLAAADIDNALDQKPELILGAQFMGMGNFRVLARSVVTSGTQADVDTALSANGQFGRAPRGTVSLGSKQVWQPTGGPDFFTTDKSAANENLLAVAPTGLGFNAPLSVAAAQTNGDFKSRVFAALGATNGTPGRVRAFEWSPLPPPLSGGVWTGTTELDADSGAGTQKARLPRGSGLRLG